MARGIGDDPFNHLSDQLYSLGVNWSTSVMKARPIIATWYTYN
uniref:Uncharacterized protein n=1 Tax=Rhizophora mucronata TaxID=61149 RepID=A0A2P2P3R5_RHIMU